MNPTKISILSTLFIFAMVTHAWSDPDKSVKNEANRITAMKLDENRSAVQKRKNPALKPAKSIKKGNSKSQSALRQAEEEAGIRGTKREVDFLKVVEEKRKARWIHFDQVLYSPEFPRGVCNNDFLNSRGAPATKSSNADISQSTSQPFPVVSNYFEGGTKLEILRHLESRKEEIFREIFMGLRFSFTPTSRHVILELNVTPSSEKGSGLIIPF
ncbi:MAG: hypothetical protein ACXU93_07945 [Thermodesulfobacteriota bacterium]